MSTRTHAALLSCCSLVIVLLTAADSPGAPRSTRPNIILLLADDMGYADPSCFGGTAVETPNLDSLARDGMRMTNFYAASAVCTPTRVSVLTGCYPLRFDVRRHFRDRGEYLPESAVTIAELLRRAGYATAHVGKWHLGGLHVDGEGKRITNAPGPAEHGFDRYQCQIEQQPLRGDMGRGRTLYRDGGTCLIRDGRRVEADDPYYTKHLTDCTGDWAVERIRQFAAGEKPFFLNVWWLVPHTPYEPAPEPHWTNTAAEGISDDQHRFRSMVAHMDAKVGGIVETLDDLGIRDNTLILFTSDNGGAYEANVAQYKGGKTDLHEAGIRVPMMISWPARISPGETSTAFGHTNDILPTLCAAAGVTLPEEVSIDGKNLLPHLVRGEAPPQRGMVFWQLDLYKHLQRHYPKPKPYSKEIVRDGRWKLLCFDSEPRELFDLEADPLEQRNWLRKHPARVARMKSALESWLAEPRQPYGNVEE